MAETVAALRADGLIEAHPDPTDGRKIMIGFATRRGRFGCWQPLPGPRGVARLTAMTVTSTAEEQKRNPAESGSDHEPDRRQ